MNNCGDCEYATWDYDEYYGGAKRWFWTGCARDHEDPEEEDCEDWRGGTE